MPPLRGISANRFSPDRTRPPRTARIGMQGSRMMHRQPVGTPCRAGRTGPQPPAAFTAADAAPLPACATKRTPRTSLTPLTPLIPLIPLIPLTPLTPLIPLIPLIPLTSRTSRTPPPHPDPRIRPLSFENRGNRNLPRAVIFAVSNRQRGIPAAQNPRT